MHGHAAAVTHTPADENLLTFKLRQWQWRTTGKWIHATGLQQNVQLLEIKVQQNMTQTAESKHFQKKNNLRL